MKRKYFQLLTQCGGYPYDAPVLADGTYEVLVVDAEPVDAEIGTVRVELTVISGPAKGDVFAITAQGLGRDPLDLLAVPGTVVVRDGAPHLTLDG